MKIIIPIAIAAASAICIASCKKDNLYRNFSRGSTVTTAGYTPAGATSPPRASAGQDRYVVYPADTFVLSGSYSQSTYEVVRYGWRQITGAAGVVIENTVAMRTKVSGLTIGEYQFEFTVKDDHGLEGRDTMRVYVAQIGDNEKVFTDLPWGNPWYATLTVKNIYSFIPPGPIKVYVWRSGHPQWEEVPHCCTNDTRVKYEYFIETRPDGAGMYAPGSLNIFYYGYDTDDSPSVKVVY